MQIAPDVPEGLFSDANAFDDTRYQEKYSRIEIDMENQADLGVCGWTRKQDGSLGLNSRDPHDWARSNRGGIALDNGYLLIARFPIISNCSGQYLSKKVIGTPITPS